MAQSVVHLGLGSNLGDRAANLLRAISRLTTRGLEVVRLSSVYQTDPVGYLDQPPFLNMVAACRITTGDRLNPPAMPGTPSALDPWALMRLCLETELELGRQRGRPLGPRTIDIDLLLFDDWQAEGNRDGVELTLPHPRMHERRFVLAPLVEIDPGIIHPLLGETAASLLDRLTDQSGVSLYLQ